MTNVIGQTAFNVAIGIMLAVAVSMAIARTWIRFLRFLRIHLDDYSLFLAVVTLIAGVGLLYANVSFLYQENKFIIGMGFEITSLPTHFVNNFAHNSNIQDAVVVMLTTSIFSVKFVFLFFFRQMADRIRPLLIWWWCVFGVLVVAAPVSVFVNFIGCPSTGVEILTKCNSPSGGQGEKVAFLLNVILNVLTDILLISLPVAVLWQVKLSQGKKLALGSLLCLSVFTIIVNILSVAVPAAFATVVWSFFTTSLETSIAVTAASMNAFRIPFTKDHQVSFNTRSRQRLVYQEAKAGGQSQTSDAD